MKDILVSFPSIRSYTALEKYFENAAEYKFPLSRVLVAIITEDDADVKGMRKMLKDAGVEGTTWTGKDRVRWFEEHKVPEFAHIIPAKSHAETSFGLLLQQTEPNLEYGLFIDDDTEPEGGSDYFATHLDNLRGNREFPHVSAARKWVNVLYQGFNEHGLYPRGFPFAHQSEKMVVANRRTKKVVCSQGLWTDVPDLDAVRILIQGALDGRSPIRTTTGHFQASFVVDPGNALTVCSMNLAFRREVIPAFYQLPMDDNKWRIGRFDDIWSGLFLKKAADILGHSIVSGFPLCKHLKTPRSTFKDLRAEVPALGINEVLWDGISDVRTGATYAEIFSHLADALNSGSKNFDLPDFVTFMAQKMKDWLACLDRIG